MNPEQKKHRNTLWMQEADSNRRPLGYEPSVITVFTILPCPKSPRYNYSIYFVPQRPDFMNFL